MSKILITTLSLLLLIFANIVSAASVTVDANGAAPRIFVGNAGYIDNGVTKTFELPNNKRHTITIGWAGNGFNRFFIDIDENGVVTSDTTRATIANNTITLNTSSITINPELFKGRYLFQKYVSGIQSFQVVPAGTGTMDEGSRYYIGNGWASFGIVFDVDVNGNITSDSSRLAISNNTLSFVTTPIEINAGLFKGRYNVGVYTQGNTTVDLIIGGTGTMDLGDTWPISNGAALTSSFRVDANGNVQSDSTRFLADGNTISIQTVPVVVDAGLYSVYFNLVSRFDQSGTFDLIPAGTGSDDGGSGWHFGNSSWPFLTKFTLDTQGNVSSNSSRISVENNTITFITTPINVNPGDYQGRYYFDGKPFFGEQNLHVLARGTGSDDYGSRYTIFIRDIGSTGIDIDSPCAIIPSEQVQIGSGEDSVTMNISCELPILDSDGDGVADTADNCPYLANSGQVDQDQDGLGNVCDDDLDGDLVDNSVDNCPDYSNVEQSDMDNDLIGDPCDDDIDGDTIPDSSDNCPLINNINQANNDSDNYGDVCDDDLDGDLVDNVIDNCPNHSNINQFDVDADGAGDVCDYDVDGDGIGNELDMCPLTAINTETTLKGCNAEQHIDEYCQLESSPNHGSYVSCVAKEAKNLVNLGLITAKEKSRYVTQAARK